MKERPILFSGAMVRAILEGRKTQTRRAIKCPSWFEGHKIGFKSYHPADFCGLEIPGRFAECISSRDAGEQMQCPYGAPFSQLWVRETFFPMPHLNAKAYFRATDRLVGVSKWKPSIFMPRALSRITLEVTGVRVERLQDITTEDAKAEGVEHACDLHPIDSYYSLWDEINGKGEWMLNPWVWVIEFKRIDARESEVAP